MPEPIYVLSAILLSAGITWALRAAPFAMLASLRGSGLLAHLGDRMPVGIMLILAAYTLRDVEASAPSIGSAALALAITAALQMWRGDMIVSIFAGTGVYVALASTVGAS